MSKIDLPYFLQQNRGKKLFDIQTIKISDDQGKPIPQYILKINKNEKEKGRAGRERIIITKYQIS